MHTRLAIETLCATVKLAANVKRSFAGPSASDNLIEALGKPEIGDVPPSVGHLQALRQKIQRLVEESQGLDGLSHRDLRDASWLLWSPAEAMAASPGLLDRIANAAIDRISIRRTLIEAWLRDFSLEAPLIAVGGEKIRSTLNAATDGRLGVWRKIDGTYDLFDAHEGPRQLATRVLTSDGAVAHSLNEAGFSDPVRLTGGYMREMIVVALKMAPTAIRMPIGLVALKRYFDLLVFDGALRFSDPMMRGATANGLLGAWVDGGSKPQQECEREVQRFLVQHLGDPRLKPQAWVEANEQAKAEIRRWLAKTSLKVFFDLIGEYALDKQYTYRRAFWEAYLDHGAISDAWLALGRRAYDHATTNRELGGAYAKLSGASANQSVLFIRIGNVIFCEWSHDGRLRAWRSESAPPLTKSAYVRSDVTKFGLPFPPDPRSLKSGNTIGDGISHTNSENGYWQGSVAELIRRETNINLTASDWMPARPRRGR